MRLVDNQFGDNAPSFSLSRDQIGLLQNWSGASLGKIKERAFGRVVVLGSGGEQGDDLSLFNLSRIDEQTDLDGRQTVRIETGNLMGVLNLSDERTGETLRIEVGSRFDKGRTGQPFLCYLLSRVFDVNYLDMVDAGEMTYLEVLLAIRFVSLLGETKNVGLYRNYRSFKCNDLKPRGKIDFARHLRENVPLGVGLAYEKREISYDLPLNHLLRLAARKIERKWPMLFMRNRHAQMVLSDIKCNTTSYGLENQQTLLANKECRVPIRHPYFAPYYEELRILARMILLGDGADIYDDGENEVSGVLFDGAWLWEEYLATVLTPLGFCHAVCGTNIGRREIFANWTNGSADIGHIYPDFYRSSGQGHVLDAKYKQSSAKREDILQALAYVLNTGAKRVGLIYPPSDGDPLCAYVCQQMDASRVVEWKSFAYKSLPSDYLSYDVIIKFMAEEENRLIKFAK